MITWPASKAKRVLAALERLGWRVKRQRGSHRLLARSDWPDYEFAFHDQDEIGPSMLARIAKRTGCGLRISDLRVKVHQRTRCSQHFGLLCTKSEQYFESTRRAMVTCEGRSREFLRMYTTEKRRHRDTER